MLAWLTIAGILVNAVVSILTLLKSDKTHAATLANGKDIDALSLNVGLPTATEQRRKWAADHPRSSHP